MLRHVNEVDWMGKPTEGKMGLEASIRPLWERMWPGVRGKRLRSPNLSPSVNQSRVLTGRRQRNPFQREQSNLGILTASLLEKICFLSLPKVGFFLTLNQGYFIIDFRKRKGDRKRDRETSMWEININRLPLTLSPTRDGTCNLGMCPDQESNPKPFGIWDNAPTNWTTQPGPMVGSLISVLRFSLLIVNQKNVS